MDIRAIPIAPLDLDKLAASFGAGQEYPAGYEPFQLRDIQTYNPLHALFLSPEQQETHGLNHALEIVDMNTVRSRYSGQLLSQRPIHIKFSPLLDPFEYMKGKYDKRPEILRQFSRKANAEASTLTKYADPNNASYVEGFFCFLSSRFLHDYGWINAVDFYGSWLALQKQFRFNIYDDLHYIKEFPKFHEKIMQGHVYCPEICDDDIETEAVPQKTRGWKQKIQFDNVPVELDDCIELAVELEPETVATADEPIDSTEPEEIYVRSLPKPASEDSDTETEEEESEGQAENDGEESVEADDSEKEDAEEDSEEEDAEEDSEADDEEWEDVDADDEDEDEDGSTDKDPTMYAYLRDFPVNMICLEKCDGTLHDLFAGDFFANEDTKCERGLALMAQVVFTLAAFQHAFSFTRNDLHTNNILFRRTDVECLYYQWQGKSYCIPTFGVVLKIIDFGRAIYRFGDRKFTSDCFSPEGDAHTQYNVEPYFHAGKTRVEENPSFDLCRLGCSIYDYVFDEDCFTRPKYMDEFQSLIWRWCCDDRGRNMLYWPDGRERYPNFRLYKMIARLVHRHTPAAQLEAFADFEVPEAEPHLPWMNIDSLPRCFVEGTEN